MATGDAAAGGLTFATIIGAQFFGINIETIAIGSAFACIGVIGKGAIEVQRALEGGAPIKLPAILGWVGGGLVGSPFVTILYLTVLKLGPELLHLPPVPYDAVAILGLLGLGFWGPKGVTWLITAVMNVGQSILGAAIKPGGVAFDAGKDGKQGPP